MKSKQTKGQFILSQPATLSATEVVAKAKAAGVKITSAYVYKVRRKAAAATAAAPSQDMHGKAFRQLVVIIGVGRASHLVAQVERGLERIVDGV